jgi:hypothetical protein
MKKKYIERPVYHRDDPKWRYEQESEAAIVGSHFAYTVATKAVNKDKLHPSGKKTVGAFRKIFYEDPIYNPALNQSSVVSGFDASLIEAQSHWSQFGNQFAQEGRKFGKVKDSGPKKPEEFPYVFERPITAHARGTGEVRPFSRIKKMSSQARMEKVLFCLLYPVICYFCIVESIAHLRFSTS